MKVGDRVAQSATFLRSICPNAAKGWPTTHDLGKGTIMAIVLDMSDCTLVDVWFDCQKLRRFNTRNLVLADANSIYYDAMRAEHNQQTREV